MLYCVVYVCDFLLVGIAALFMSFAVGWSVMPVFLLPLISGCFRKSGIVYVLLMCLNWIYDFSGKILLI